MSEQRLFTCIDCKCSTHISRNAMHQRQSRNALQCRDCKPLKSRWTDAERDILWQLIANDLGVYGSNGRKVAI